MTAAQTVGHHLREWRQRRRLSQLALAGDADISTKHLSFLETGRARPSREMVLRLAERLDLPLRERNVLLVAAGYAPVFPQRDLGDRAMTAVRAAVDQVIAGHEPYPALAVDRHWNLVAANSVVSRLIAGADPALLQPPVNVLRLSLHPDGLAPRIVNYREWRAHLLARLRRQIDLSADPVLVALLHELEGYRAPANVTPGPQLVRQEAELVCRPAGRRRRRAVVHQHHDGVRHAGRRHAFGTGHRIVLSGRCRDRRQASQSGFASGVGPPCGQSACQDPAGSQGCAPRRRLP